MDIDFGNGAAPQNGGQQAGGTNNNPANEPDKTPLGGGGTEDLTHKDNNGNGDTPPPDGDGNKPNQEEEESSAAAEPLAAGTEIEYEGVTYTVNENGDIVDKDGKVFKKADEVADFLKANEVNDSEGEQTLSLDSIKEHIGVDVTDENGKPIEFTDDVDGVKTYLDAVMSLKSNDIAQGAVNKLYADNPLLKQFVDYVTVNGTAKGFGEIPDSSNIKLDKDNPSQLKAIIRMAAQEFGNKSMNESYIKYLEESGTLYDVAKEQLEALVGQEKAYRKEIETRAAAMREKEEQDVRDYWQSVSDAIAKRVIGGYKLPDSFVKEVNGQKITYTPDDFYKYLSEGVDRDETGNVLTAYQRDLNKLSKEEVLAKDLLDAWLVFTGGSYKDIIDMAVKEDAVRKLVIKSKQNRTSHTVKINPPKQDKKVNPNDILF